jgi:hypothetical protein
MSLRLPAEAAGRFEAAAAKRSLTREAMQASSPRSRLRPHLIDNILDDGV